jgi:hypothetical protein
MLPCLPSAAAAAAAVWLREGLVRLGPTFIKIGQQFSTRVDVLSPEFVKELEKLQVGAARRNVILNLDVSWQLESLLLSCLSVCQGAEEAAGAHSWTNSVL